LAADESQGYRSAELTVEALALHNVSNSALILNEGDYSHNPFTLGALEWIDLVDPLDASGPRRWLARWFKRFRFLTITERRIARCSFLLSLSSVT
jgi:hypothetical protein